MKQLLRYLSFLLVFAMFSSMATMYAVATEDVARSYLISESFDGEERPDSLTYYEGSGAITVEDVNGERALYLNNVTDGTYTLISKNFTAVTEGTVTTEVKFMQPDVTSDGNIILEALSNTDVIFSVVTESGNLSAKQADGTYSTLLSGYSADTWYTIKTVTDITNQTTDFYIDGELKIEDAVFNAAVSSINTISSYAKTTPGFYLDDLIVAGEVQYQSLSVSGADKAPVPKDAGTELATEFSALLLSMSSSEVTGNLQWSISGDTTDVRIEASDDTMSAKLYVGTTATIGGVVTITVTVAGGTLSDSITVTLQEMSLNKVVISGDARVSAYNGKATEFAYTAKVYDQFNNEIPNHSFVWELDNQSLATIEVSENGVLTVSGTMPDKDQKAYLTARLADDSLVYGTKSILVQSYDTYNNDKQRLEAAIKGVDNIIKAASNPDGRNPLMGFYISPYKNTYGYWNLHGPERPTPCSNLTEQFELMRAMDGITGLTGDESYKQRVRDMYKWYLDHGISNNGLVYWGNHQTMDLETGEWAEYFNKYATAQPYVEVKDRDLYLNPFFEIDPAAAAKIIKDHWCAIIDEDEAGNWDTMSFNRHALIDKNNGPVYSGWENPDGFLQNPNPDDPDDPWVRTKDLSFMSSAAAMLAYSDFGYQFTKDTDMLLWGYRLIYRYIDTRYEFDETQSYSPEEEARRRNADGMFGTLFTSPKRMEGLKSLVDDFGEQWWTIPGIRSYSGDPGYGDRFVTQFGHMLTSGGYMTEEQVDKEAFEGAFLFSNYTICSAIFNDSIHLAKTMMSVEGDEIFEDGMTVSQAGKQLAMDYMKGVAAYIKCAYDFEQNLFHRVLTNGLVIDDIVWTRPGYWGSAGKTFGSEKPSDFHADNFIKAYLMTADIPELEEERELMWEAARNICDKTYHMGDIGNPIKGEKPNLNLAIHSTDTTVIRMLLTLYEASGWDEYLTQARIVANNITANVFKGDYFIDDTTKQYINTDGEYPYVLLKLEATLRGEPDLVPDSRYLSHHECDAVYMDERSYLESWTSAPHKNLTFPTVKVTEIRFSEYDLELKVGEEKSIDVTIRPDDASSKAINWDIKDRDIVNVTGNNSFVGLKEGETVVYAASRSTTGIVSKPLYIKVTR